MAWSPQYPDVLPSDPHHLEWNRRLDPHSVNQRLGRVNNCIEKLRREIREHGDFISTLIASPVRNLTETGIHDSLNTLNEGVNQLGVELTLLGNQVNESLVSLGTSGASSPGENNHVFRKVPRCGQKLNMIGKIKIDKRCSSLDQLIGVLECTSWSQLRASLAHPNFSSVSELNAVWRSEDQSLGEKASELLCSWMKEKLRIESLMRRQAEATISRQRTALETSRAAERELRETLRDYEAKFRVSKSSNSTSLQELLRTTTHNLHLYDTDEDIVRRILTQLDSTREKLDAQIEQSNELEALLAERDSRIVAQANELTEVESQLAASTELISSLHERLSTNHRQLTQLLKQMNLKAGGSLSDCPWASDLPAVPAVLELATSLDTAYAELQESERLRVIAERRAASATNTARDLRAQLRLCASRPRSHTPPRNPQLGDSSCTSPSVPKSLEAVTQTEHRTSSVSIQTDSRHISNVGDAHVNLAGENQINQGNSDDSEKVDILLTYGLTRPQSVLDQVNDDDLVTTHHVVELREALRNAVSQIDRLNKYRIAQKTKYDRLQHRFAQMSSELDATVDALRTHQTSNEMERRRTAVELAQLRTQLAKATTLLEHYKLVSLKKVEDGTPQLGSTRAASASPVTPRSNGAGKPTTQHSFESVFSNDLTLQLATAQKELTQLRLDMTQQRADSEKIATKLRGLLAEANSDNRALRIQLTRAQMLSGSKDGDLSKSDLVCNNCQRLQRLLDLLQAKRETANTKGSGALKDTLQLDNLTAPIKSISETGTQTSVSTQLPLHEAQQQEFKSALETEVEKGACELTQVEKSIRKQETKFLNDSDRPDQQVRLLDTGQDSMEQELLMKSAKYEREIQELRDQLDAERAQLTRERSTLADKQKSLDAQIVEQQYQMNELTQKRTEAETLINLAMEEKVVNASYKEQLQARHNALDVYKADLDRQRDELLLEKDRLATERKRESHSEMVQTELSYAHERNELESKILLTSEPVMANTASLLGENFDHPHDVSGSKENMDGLDVNSVSEELLLLKCQLHEEWSKFEKEKVAFRKLQEQLAMQHHPVAADSANEPESPGLVPSSSSSTEPPLSYSQLASRLHAAEREAEDAVEQLKASNAEFLTLRERLSHAAMERAQLKATVEGLDEQVSQLENALYERTQEVQQCRRQLEELQRASQSERVQIPTANKVHESDSVPKRFHLHPINAVLHEVNQNTGLPTHSLATRISMSPLFQSESTMISVEPLVDRENNYWVSRLHHSFVRRQLNHIRVLVLRCGRAANNLVSFCSWGLSRARYRCTVQSLPRPQFFMLFLIYFLFVHFLLLRFWLS
ncbi:unnamed protein product [Calicophoron daubneyi]|uniref:Uncharacterized protein n=1 Tax=Calicophoron daubneyi TaxID=300641 RepID=A0AAV2T5I0_CALDB